nr:MAG TPA: hypothetical protein [Caudoviricetes sp.]
MVQIRILARTGSSEQAFKTGQEYTCTTSHHQITTGRLPSHTLRHSPPPTNRAGESPALFCLLALMPSYGSYLFF